MRCCLSVTILVLIFSPAAYAGPIVQPYERFSGQAIGEEACNPIGSTRTMSICYALWLKDEERLLQQSTERLAAYAQEQEAQSAIFSGPRGYVASIAEGQSAWVAWRDHECILMTLDSVGGSLRTLTYPGCQARLTAQRHRQLDAALELWRGGFRDAQGDLRSVACILAPGAFPACAQ